MLNFSFGENFDTPCALVLGGFDGLHLGHRRLLAAAKKTGLPVLLTTMYGGKGKQLFTRGERLWLFAQAGVFAVCEIVLSSAVRALSAEQFSERLFSSVQAKVVVCGEDFRFGKDAAGTPQLLERSAPCPVLAETAVKELSESGRPRKIATSTCKEWLKRGDLPALNARLAPSAEEFFGGAYFVLGRVEHGRQVGRTYGFPTLNLTPPPEKQLPPDGVYGGLCATPRGNYPTIVNFGARPTFGVRERKIEAYLDGFSGDLYGEEVRVYPTEFYRGITAFQSAEELRAQLMRDVARLRGKEKHQ